MLNTIITDIQCEAEKIVYLSEQTHEVNLFIIGRTITQLNAEIFESANPILRGRVIETLDAEVICDTQNWFDLKNVMTTYLTNLKAFKVGLIRREVYVVGLYKGRIIGVRSFAIET